MPQTIKLALLDDYQKVALRMADWDRLKKRGVEITVFHEAFKSVDDAAQKLAPFDILGLLRERTAFPRALIEKLPNLKFMVLTGARAASLDDKAAAERGIPISTTGGGGSNAPTAELGWALLMMCARDLGKAERLARTGKWHDGIEQAGGLEGKRRGVEPEPYAREGGGRRRQVRQQRRATLDVGLRVDPSRSVGSHARTDPGGRPRQDEEDGDPGEHLARTDRRRGRPDPRAQTQDDPRRRPRRLRQGAAVGRPSADQARQHHAHSAPGLRRRGRLPALLCRHDQERRGLVGRQADQRPQSGRAEKGNRDVDSCT